MLRTGHAVAGVGAEQVNGTEKTLSGVDQFSICLDIGDVELKMPGPDRLGHSRNGVSIDVGEHEPSWSFVGEAAGHGSTDATPCTGDDDDLCLELHL